MLFLGTVTHEITHDTSRCYFKCVSSLATPVFVFVLTTSQALVFLIFTANFLRCRLPNKARAAAIISAGGVGHSYSQLYTLSYQS